MKRQPIIVLITLLLLAACTPVPARLQPAPVVIPTQEQEERQADPTPTTIPTPTAEPEPTESPPTVEPEPEISLPTGSLPAPTLFDFAWDDRSPFAAGLVSGEQATREQHPGASIYHIDLTISDDLTRLDGREEVRYTNTEDVPLHDVHFRLFPNIQDGGIAISNITVDSEMVEASYEVENSDLIVPLPQPLQPGEQVVIGMDFRVDVPTESGGNYGIFASVDDILTPAHFYPMIAVYDDEGWNVELTPPAGDPTYADTSYFLVRIDAPAGQTIVASGSETGREEQDGRQTITIAAGPVRDFFFATSDRYELVSETVGETKVNAYATSDLLAENDLALRYATDALRIFNERYGLYPYTELDVVGTPTLAGGVEYPGLVVVALAIYDPDLQFFESATAHEVGHQWFYNMVGNDQLDDPWLDEALTQWATMMYYNDVYGQSGYDGARQGMDSRWSRVDYEDIPIGMPVAAYHDNEYGAIVYGRGPLFFEALRDVMGEETHEAFLRDYAQTFKWDIATPESFKTLAEEHCGCDLTPLFEEWVY